MGTPTKISGYAGRWICRISGWLEDCEAMKKEYLLPKIIDKLLAEKKAQVTLLETADKWFGVTYKDDKAVVVEAIKALIEQGVYKKRLFDF